MIVRVQSKSYKTVSVILVLVIIIAITTTIYLIVSPKESEHFSEFYILGETGMAADYPDELIAGLQYPMFIGFVPPLGMHGVHSDRNFLFPASS